MSKKHLIASIEKINHISLVDAKSISSSVVSTEVTDNDTTINDISYRYSQHSILVKFRNIGLGYALISKVNYRIEQSKISEEFEYEL